MENRLDFTETELSEVSGRMSLAEALQVRADIKTEIAQLHNRLNDNAKVQEGESPAEDPMRLTALLSAKCAAFETIVRRINLTNASTVFEGKTITDLLARRDALSLETSILRDFLQQASQRVDRYSKTEIKILSSVDVTAMQKTVDAKSKELRQLDATIQKLNWNTELV